MNPSEFHTAAAGSAINNRPIKDVSDIIGIAISRLPLAASQRPKESDLLYIAQQAFNRHRYTVEELYLAVDLCNAGELNYELPERRAFTVRDLNSLMFAYRAAKEKYVKNEYVDADTEEKNRRAPANICNTIYRWLKEGKEPERLVMYPYTMAYQHLLSEGKVTEQHFQVARRQAEDLRAADKCSDTPGMLRNGALFGATIEDYQAYIVAVGYIKTLVK